jgi:hypothetical protein
MFTTLPKFGMELAVVFNDYTVRGETVAALVRHIVEAVLDLAADLGFIAAAATDKIKGAEEVFWIGLATFLACATSRVGLKGVDYLLEHDSANK